MRGAPRQSTWQERLRNRKDSLTGVEKTKQRVVSDRIRKVGGARSYGACRSELRTFLQSEVKCLSRKVKVISFIINGDILTAMLRGN